MACRERADQLAQLDDLPRVETVGRLVEDQHLGLIEQRLRDHHPLTIAPRQLGDRELADCIEGEPRAARLDRARQGAGIETLEAAHEGEELVDPHAGVKGHVLGHVADPAARLQAVLDDVEAGDRRSARGGLQIAREDAQDRRLARAVRPEQPEHLADAGLEGDVVDAEPAAVALGQMLRDDDRRHEPRTEGAGAARPPRAGGARMRT
jgi:hypothetical protein